MVSDGHREWARMVSLSSSTCICLDCLARVLDYHSSQTLLPCLASKGCLEVVKGRGRFAAFLRIRPPWRPLAAAVWSPDSYPGLEPWCVS